MKKHVINGVSDSLQLSGEANQPIRKGLVAGERKNAAVIGLPDTGVHVKHQYSIGEKDGACTEDESGHLSSRAV